MKKQQSTLVLLIKECRALKILHPGVYFVIKVGKKCIRFNNDNNELVFQLDEKGTLASLEMFMFQRRKNSGLPAGRRRDLLDSTCAHLLKSACSKRTETCIEWKSYVVEFAAQSLSFVIDIEFYPYFPLLPLKNEQKSSQARNMVAGKPPTGAKKQLPLQQASLQKIPEPTNKEDHRKTRKRDRFRLRSLHNLTKGLATVDANRTEDETKNNSNIIFYDLKNLKNSTGLPSDYQHGSSPSQTDLVRPMDGKELYTFVKKNQHKPATDEKLILDISPQAYFNSPENRMKYNQRLNFVSMFSSNNIKLTGYLGSGKWDKLELSDTFINWYLKPEVRPLNSPQLPPKCPVGMLWEEYYLINKDIYIHDVLAL